MTIIKQPDCIYNLKHLRASCQRCFGEYRYMLVANIPHPTYLVDMFLGNQLCKWETSSSNWCFEPNSSKSAFNPSQQSVSWLCSAVLMLFMCTSPFLTIIHSTFVWKLCCFLDKFPYHMLTWKHQKWKWYQMRGSGWRVRHIEGDVVVI